MGLVSFIVLMFSCKDYDYGSIGYNFKNQHAMGEIAGQEWAYQNGYSDIDDGNLHVTLMLSQDGQQGCEVFLADGDQVFFTVPADEGIYKLNFGSNNARTATLFDDDEAFNHIAADGAIEILDISNTQVKGRINAVADEDANYVNGNFTVPICN
jgi:hypothetical protein